MEERTMKNILQFSRKLVVLAAMLSALGALTFTDFGNTAQGGVLCCSDCEVIYQNCIIAGGKPAQCNLQAYACRHNCDINCKN